MSWDWVIGAGIILALVLAIILRITGSTISELLGGIKEFLLGMKEDMGEEQFVQFYE